VSVTLDSENKREVAARDIQKNAHILHGNRKLRASIKVSFINYNTKLLRKFSPRVPKLYVIVLLLCIISKTPNRTLIILYQPAAFLLSCKNTSCARTVYAVGAGGYIIIDIQNCYQSNAIIQYNNIILYYLHLVEIKTVP